MTMKKPKPNKQKEMGAATLLRMAKDYRHQAEIEDTSSDGDSAVVKSCKISAEVCEREAKKLRAMR